MKTKKRIVSISVIIFAVILMVTSASGFVEQLTVNQTNDIIMIGENYRIEGTATNVGAVDIIFIGSDGYSKPMSSPYLGIKYGLYVISASVTNSKFTKDIEMTGAVTGQWEVIVLSAGMDGFYGDYRPSGFAEWKDGSKCRVFDSKIYTGTFNIGIDKTDGISNNYGEFDEKTQMQVHNILFTNTKEYSEYAQVLRGASDDLICTRYFEIVPVPIVTTTPIPTSIPTVTSVLTSTPSPSPTPTPSSTPTPTVTSTPSPTTPTPTPPTPGFEAIFTIAVILGFVILLMKRKGLGKT